MNILVTGAAGQLGQSIQARTTQNPWARFFFTDITDLDITNGKSCENYIIKHKIKAIINCAAYTAVDLAEQEQEKCKTINALAPEILAQLAAKFKLLFIHISSDYVFNGKTYRPYNELDVCAPLSVYGWSKLEGEKRIFKHYPSAIVIRSSWLYSEYGNNFVKTISRLAQERPNIQVVYDQVGTPTYAGDLAECILYMLQHFQPDNMHGIFHFSNEGVASWYDFAHTILHYLHTPCHITPVLSSTFNTPAVRPPYSVLDKAKIKEVCSFEIPHWSESLLECLSQSCMQKPLKPDDMTIS